MKQETISAIFVFCVTVVFPLLCIGTMLLLQALKGKSRLERATALAAKQAQEARRQFGKGKAR